MKSRTKAHIAAFSSLLIGLLLTSSAQAVTYRLCGGPIPLLGQVPASTRGMNIDSCRYTVPVDFGDCVIIDKDGRRLIAFGGAIIGIDLRADEMKAGTQLPFGLKFGMSESAVRKLTAQYGARNWEVVYPNDPEGRALVLKYPDRKGQDDLQFVALKFNYGKLVAISCDVPEAGP